VFRLEIETSNDAFGDDPWWEVSSILAGLAKRVREGAPTSGVLRDGNGARVGSRVGSWELTDDEENEA
jgi:hypothetical protein